MKTAPIFSMRDAVRTFAAAAFAAFVAVSLFSGTAYLFERNGKPLERLAAAERACVHHGYQPERQACMNEWLAASPSAAVARR